MQNTVLPEFQDFLTARNLVLSKSVPYCAHWASKFLSFSSKNESLSSDVLLEKFLTALRSTNNVEDWQVR